MISTHKSPIDNITIGDIETDSSSALLNHNIIPNNAEHLNEFLINQQVIFFKFNLLLMYLKCFSITRFLLKIKLLI